MSQDTDSFATTIGIPEISINVARNVMQLCFLSKLPGLMIGPSSTAKTATIRALAKYNGARCVIFTLANKEPQDITGPQFPTKGGTFVYLRDGQVPVKYTPAEIDTQTTQREAFAQDLDYAAERAKHDTWSSFFKSLADGAGDSPRAEKLVDAYYRALDGEERAKEKVVILFDEVNRADKAVLNAVMAVWAERKLGPHELGDNVFVAAAMNPPDGMYNVTQAFSTDPAIRRRLVTSYVVFNNAIFQRYRLNPLKAQQAIDIPAVDWAKPRGRNSDLPFHHAVSSYLNANQDMQYDTQSYMGGKVFGCPSTWENVSALFEAIDEHGIRLDTPSTRTAVLAAIAGCVNEQVAHDVIAHYETTTEQIEPLELVTDFGEERNPTLWGKVNRMVGAGEYGKLQDLLNSAQILLQEMEPEGEAIPAIVDSVGNLLLALPFHVASSLLQTLGARTSASVEDLAATIMGGLVYGVTPDGLVNKGKSGYEHHPGYEHYYKESRRIADQHAESLHASRSAQAE